MAAQKTMMYVDTLPTKQSMAPRRHCECGPLLAHCHLGLGKLYRRTDKREQAQKHLATATMMYHGMEMTYWREQAEAEMRSLA
jgi:hypothetical protein